MLLYSPPPSPPEVLFQPDSLSFIGLAIFLVLTLGVALDLLESDAFDWEEFSIFQVMSLGFGTLAYALAFLEIDEFQLNAAWHVALMSLAFVCGLRHIGRRADFHRRTTSAITAFSVLPLLLVIFAKAERIKTTSCKLVSIISLSVAFFPVAIAFRAIKRASGDTARPKRRIFVLLLCSFTYQIFIFPESVCYKKWTAYKIQAFNLFFDLSIALCTCDLLYSIRN